MAIDNSSTIKYESDIDDIPFLLQQQQLQHQQFVQPAISLLNSLTAFYQHERNWVHRTRASLELEFIQDNPIHSFPQPPPSTTSNANFNITQRSSSRSFSDGNYTYSNTSSIDDPTFNNIPVNIKKEEEEDQDDFDLSSLDQQSKHSQRSRQQMPPPPTPSPLPPLPASRFSQRYQAGAGPPPTLNSDDSISSSSTNTTSSSSASSASVNLSSMSTSATGPIRTPKRVQGPGPAQLAQGFPAPGQGLAGRHPRPLPPPTRWHKRKQSFGLYLGSLAASRPLRSKDIQSSQQANGGSDESSLSEPRDPEPSTQLLELFGALVESRMESCERIARLIRDTSSLSLGPPPVPNVMPSRPSAMATIPLDPSLMPNPNMSVPVGVPEQDLNGAAPPPMYNGIPVGSVVNGFPIQMNGMVDMNEMPMVNGFGPVAVDGMPNGVPLVNGIDIDVNDMNSAAVNGVGMNGATW